MIPLVVLFAAVGASVVHAADLPRFAPVTASEAFAEFGRLCLQDPTDKAAYVRAARASDWGFAERIVDGTPADRVDAETSWLSSRGLVVAYHGEVRRVSIPPYHCVLHVTLQPSSDVDLERAGQTELREAPTFRYFLPHRANLTWTRYDFSAAFATRQISAVLLHRGTAAETFQVSVVYEPRTAR